MVVVFALVANGHDLTHQKFGFLFMVGGSNLVLHPGQILPTP